MIGIDLDLTSEGLWTQLLAALLSATSSSLLASPPGSPKKEVYFMAIIDILTPYDAKKKAAHAAKTVKHGVSSPSLQPGPVGGPSDSQASSFTETLPPPLSQGRGQEERPARLPGVHSLHLYSSPG